MNRPCALLSAMLLIFIPGLAMAQAVNQPVPEPPSYEYVQQASSLQYDGQTLTLQGVAPSTIFFSDRPYRLTGQVDTATFANLWTAPNGPFSQNPPNAAISVLGETGVSPAIVELTSATADGTSVAYGVKILSGEIPASAENIALFVDHGPRPVNGVHYYPYHPVPGPYCYHAPQAPECRYRPYHPYHPYYPPYYPYYHPGAAFAAGAAVGAAAASRPTTVYVYPLPNGPLPAQCHINSNHTRMICSVPLTK
ncbi:MAG: hypothetical protein NXI27_23470 [Alphaproteobacteria bacterium]|nr:hypothetical protein [Alphaproteobacteria bacterium]